MFFLGGNPPNPPLKFQKKTTKIRSIPQIFKDLFLLGETPKPPFEVSENKIEKKKKKRSIPQIFKDLFLLGGDPPTPPPPPQNIEVFDRERRQVIQSLLLTQMDLLLMCLRTGETICM